MYKEMTIKISGFGNDDFGCTQEQQWDTTSRLLTKLACDIKEGKEPTAIMDCNGGKVGTIEYVMENEPDKLTITVDDLSTTTEDKTQNEKILQDISTFEDVLIGVWKHMQTKEVADFVKQQIDDLEAEIEYGANPNYQS